MMSSIEQRQEAHIHYAAACIGGFLGVFPVLSVARLFGSAQTANMIELVISALAGNATALVLHCAGLALYCAGVLVATVLPKHIKCNLQLVAMGVDTIAAFVMWRIPHGLPDAVYLFPTYAAMSFHWCAFKGAYGFVSATVFSTNNLRMFVASLAEIVCNGDRSFVLKARFFGATLAAFHLGVAAGWGCWCMLSEAGFLCALIPVFVCTALILHAGKTQ